MARSKGPGSDSSRAPRRSEPDYVAYQYEKDPLAAARHTLSAEVSNQASAGFDGEPVRKIARRILAQELLGEVTRDDEVLDGATVESDDLTRSLSEAPAAGLGDVAVRLSILIKLLARDTASPRACVLAASCLADVIVLGETPLCLPARAGDLIADVHDVAYWRARAGRVR